MVESFIEIDSFDKKIGRRMRRNEGWMVLEGKFGISRRKKGLWGDLWKRVRKPQI